VSNRYRDFVKIIVLPNFIIAGYGVVAAVNVQMSNLRRWQAKFMGAAVALLPVAPFLFLQGEVTRWKVGLLPDAAGGKYGHAGEDG
jgi:hypothetical protein